VKTQRSSGPAPSRRNAQSRQAILTAAFDLVEELGYAGLTIEGIAARAGVGKQTIYRWWPSKGAVLFDALLALGQTDSGQDAALPDTGDLETDLKTVLRATVAELNNKRYDVPMRALTIEILQDPAIAAQYAERLDKPLTELKKQRLRRAQQTGELPADLDLDLAIDLLWGPLMSRWINRSPLTPEYTDRLVEAALAGMRHTATSGSAPPALA
jgi:AcrR family transcriptional regulator